MTQDAQSFVFLYSLAFFWQRSLIPEMADAQSDKLAAVKMSVATKPHSSTFAGNIIKLFMSEQHYKNHSQVVYSYYLLTGVPILILIIISIKWITTDDVIMKLWGLMFLLVGWIFLTMLFKSRGFALKAQDRAIRAEENLRHFVLTGKLHDHRLTMKQIIALRFAPDEEVALLSQRAVSENLSADAIKKEIKNWRADTYRV